MTPPTAPVSDPPAASIDIEKAESIVLMHISNKHEVRVYVNGSLRLRADTQPGSVSVHEFNEDDQHSSP